LPPRVTVLMPVYNAASYVAEATGSILSGSFRDLELVAINDGSTDESEDKLRAITDSRLKIVNNPANLGVVKTLNRGLDLADGEFIARMDADDISMPQRLMQQLAFMDRHPEIGVCGTWATTFGRGPRVSLRPPLRPAEIRVQLFGYNALTHPTVMFRRALFLRHELRFCTAAVHAEDLDLWMRAAEHFPLANIPVVGLRYRLHANQIANRYAIEEQQTLRKLRRRQLALLIPEATEAEAALHLQLLDPAAPLTHSELVAGGQWLERLADTNQRSRRYDPQAFRAFLAVRWLNAAHRCVPRTAWVWSTWQGSPLAKAGVGARLRLLLKSLGGVSR
jgi:glycosyltransferase involved in cell wall biosynthesis